MNPLVVVLLVILLLGGLGGMPVWGHAHNWGWGPSGGIVGLLVLILVILLLTGRL